MKPIKGAWLLLCLAFATGVVRAQGVGASGDITGTVNDPALSSTPRWYACSMGCVSAAGYTRALKAGEACLGSTQLESDAHRHV